MLTALTGAAIFGHMMYVLTTSITMINEAEEDHRVRMINSALILAIFCVSLIVLQKLGLPI